MTAILPGSPADGFGDQGTAIVLFSDNQADAGNGANAAADAKAPDLNRPVSSNNAQSMIDELQGNIHRLRALRDSCEWPRNAQLMRKIDDELEREFEEIRRLQHGGR